MSTSTSTTPSSTASSSAREAIYVGLCQVLVGADKAANWSAAKEAVYKASELGARLILLPECWNCPYSNACFPEYAEPIPGVGEGLDPAVHLTLFKAAEWAKDLKVFIVAGSIPEREGEKIFNTSVVINPKGEIIAKHRKLHLFDIDVPGRITFRESDTLTAGSEITTFDIDPSLVAPVDLDAATATFTAGAEAKTDPEAKVVPASSPFKVGLGICYDMRFAEYAQVCADRGAKMLLYPGAFNTVTGPAHWELLQRARAIDNQLVCIYHHYISPSIHFIVGTERGSLLRGFHSYSIAYAKCKRYHHVPVFLFFIFFLSPSFFPPHPQFVATCSPARTPSGEGYQAWGGSSLVSPWATVLARADEKPAVVVALADLARVPEVRGQIPVRFQKKKDLYEVIDKKKL